jgi:transcriptional regulator with PAS, ATPase and Fis domain
VALLDTTELDQSASSRAPAVLLVAGRGRLSLHRLGKPRLVIGRAPDCDVSLGYASLSRHHAAIDIGPPLSVTDLGSTNGTRIAGQLHHGGAPRPIRLGESFHIGPFSFVVLDDTAAASDAESLRDQLVVEDPTVPGVPPSVRDVAASAISVIILGETGVGKEVLASTLHALSGRQGPLVQINCAAFAETLIERELFGHEKGAFTGASTSAPGMLEAARGGTIFLDEVGELPAPLQAKLLRAVEAHEVIRIGGTRPIQIDVRFIAATNRDLGAEVAAGAFRRDLYFRLDGITIHIPPLRERKDMIVPLALRFLAAARPGAVLAQPVIAKLLAHSWPGNVRELKAVIERAVLLAAGKDVAPRHLVLAKLGRATPPENAADSTLSPDAASERDAIVAALEACAGNQTQAARRLGISRSTLATKLPLYKIPRPRSR